MESGTSKKLKIALLCHFSNKEIRQHLPLAESGLKKKLKQLLGKTSKRGFSDFGPWVTNLIKELQQFDDLEIHVISPFIGLTKYTHEFTLNGAHYHFFNPDFFKVHTPLPNTYNWVAKIRFFQNRLLVKKFINKIKPDLVNLIGTENPYYSVTTLDIKGIPVYVSAQTVYTNPDRKKHSDSCVPLNWDTEMLIHKKEKYYGCTGRMYRDLILNNNPEAIVFKMFYPIERPKQVKELPKLYDFVFFAGIAKKKGIEDLIDALALVKKTKSDVTLNIIGRCSKDYRNFLVQKIDGLGLKSNIVFDEYFAVQSDMHQHLVQSRFAVLPVKLDVIPASVVEAILLGLPLITYKTTGTPYLNKDGECILLADIGDVEMLAKQMLKFLDSPSFANTLAENAKAFVDREFDNTVSARRLANNFRAVVEHYNHQVPIPSEQLFDVNEFPIYQ